MTGDVGISVVIPTYNRPDEIEGCLESLSLQDFARDAFEVIVVDDGSRVQLDHFVDRFSSKLRIQVIRQENYGPAAARNKGILAATGSHIVMVDDDCRPDPDWLITVATEIRKKPDTMIGGHTVNLLTGNPYADASQVLIDMIYHFYNENPENPRFFTSNNMVVSRDQVVEMGLFREDFRFAEDREFCDRWLASGYRLAYRPSIIMYHRHSLTLKGFWKQHFGYGRGGYQYQNLRKTRGTGSIRDDASFHLRFYKWMPALKDGVSIWIAARRLGLILLSQVANLAGFLSEVTTARR
jgi:GT2 family glycosyltransferase